MVRDTRYRLLWLWLEGQLKWVFYLVREREALNIVIEMDEIYHIRKEIVQHSTF